MTHEEAVRIARSGEGAVVGELKRLNAELEQEKDSANRMRERIVKFVDAVTDLKKQIEAMEYI